MLHFPPIPELSVIGVYQPGIPNEERVALKAEQALNIGYFAVGAGWKTPDGGAVPLPDHFFWLGDQIVHAGTIILLYTGKGARSSGVVPNSSVGYITLFWGRPQTIFHNHNVIPLLTGLGRVGFTLNAPMLMPPKPEPKLPSPPHFPQMGAGLR